MKKKRWLILVAVLVAIFVVTGVIYNYTKEQGIGMVKEEVTETTANTEEATAIAVDLSAIVVAGQDGELIQLADEIGKPMVINLWATWCPPCREEMPDLQNAWQTHQEEVDFYLVNAIGSQPDETKANVAAFLAETDLSMPIYYDEDNSTSKALQAQVLPTTVFVNAAGEVTHYQMGMITAEELERQIQKIIE